MSIKNGELSIDEPGIVRFVEKVDQVTFSDKQVLKDRKRVFYVTNVVESLSLPKGLEVDSGSLGNRY